MKPECPVSLPRQGQSANAASSLETISSASQHADSKFLVPPSFYCPLTCDVMFHPVLDRQGNSYERVAIEAWLHLNQTSPLTEQPLEARALIPNRAMQDVIHGFMGTEWKATKQRQLPTGHLEDFISNSRWQRPRHTCEYRRRVDSYLNDISNAINMELMLNENGACMFQYENLAFYIQVDEHTSYVTLSCESIVEEITDEIKGKMLRLSHFQTRGACLSLNSTQGNRETVRLVYIKSISAELSSKKFGRVLEDFLGTAISLKALLTMHQVSESESDKSNDETKRKRQPEEDNEGKRMKVSG